MRLMSSLVMAGALTVAVLPAAGSIAAQEASPALPRAKYCVAPETPVELPARALASASPAAMETAATPAADDLLPAGSEITLANIPVGDAADAETALALFGLEVGYASCYNAGQFANVAALLTPDARVRFVEGANLAGFGDRFTEPRLIKPALRIPSVLVHDEQLLPDGRAIAIVDWDVQSSLHVYVKDGDQWLLDRQLTITDGETAPAATSGTPPTS